MRTQKLLCLCNDNHVADEIDLHNICTSGFHLAEEAFQPRLTVICLRGLNAQDRRALGWQDHTCRQLI